MFHARSLAYFCGLAAAPLSCATAQWTATVLTTSGNAYGHATAGGLQGGSSSPSLFSYQHASLWNGTAGSLVDLHPAGATQSVVLGMSATTQVGWTWDGSHHYAALWQGTAASWVNLNPSGSQNSDLYATDGTTHVGVVQMGSPINAHAAVWTGTSLAWGDINPPGANSSIAYAIGDGQIVGSALFPASNQHAALWIDSASSYVDLHPAVAVQSFAYGVAGGQQVGSVLMGNINHASLWNGTANSWVDLNPSPSLMSEANAVFAGQQVGYTSSTSVTSPRAALWNGTAASWVDLHAFLPSLLSTGNSYATGIWSDGSTLYVVGYASQGSSSSFYAVLWTKPIGPGTLAGNTVLGHGRSQLSLAPTTRPVLGSNWQLTVDNIPATTVFGLHFFGLSDPGVLDMTAFGMPGCPLRASLDLIVGPWLPSGATFAYDFVIPATPPSLVGLQLFTQAATFGSPPVNAFGAITSGGVRGTIGDL